MGVGIATLGLQTSCCSVTSVFISALSLSCMVEPLLRFRCPGSPHPTMADSHQSYPVQLCGPRAPRIADVVQEHFHGSCRDAIPQSTGDLVLLVPGPAAVFFV